MCGNLIVNFCTVHTCTYYIYTHTIDEYQNGAIAIVMSMVIHVVNMPFYYSNDSWYTLCIHTYCVVLYCPSNLKTMAAIYVCPAYTIATKMNYIPKHSITMCIKWFIDSSSLASKNKNLCHLSSLMFISFGTHTCLTHNSL